MPFSPLGLNHPYVNIKRPVSEASVSGSEAKIYCPAPAAEPAPHACTSCDRLQVQLSDIGFSSGFYYRENESVHDEFILLVQFHDSGEIPELLRLAKQSNSPQVFR